MTNEADDWEVQGVCQAGGGAFFAGGIWVFQFSSSAADFDGFFTFQGMGLGAGGSLGGVSFPMDSILRQIREKKAANQLQQHMDLWTDLKCENTFSADQLNWAPGRLSTASVGAALGYGLVYISAGALPRKSLFLSQSVGGWGTGVGATAATLVGVWKFLTKA